MNQQVVRRGFPSVSVGQSTPLVQPVSQQQTVNPSASYSPFGFPPKSSAPVGMAAAEKLRRGF